MATKKNEWLGFYKEFKLHKACANDDFRPAMEYVCFKNGYAYATDAHIAVRARLSDICALSDEDIEKLNGYMIHHSQYALLLKYSTIEIGEGTIVLIDSKLKTRTTIQLTKFAETDEELKSGNGLMRYPNVDAIINNDLSKEPLKKVGFNFALLGRIIAAMGITSDRVGLRFTTSGHQMVVLGVEPGIDVRGIIMPILMNETL